jgi:hypothetical protein
VPGEALAARDAYGSRFLLAVPFSSREAPGEGDHWYAWDVAGGPRGERQVPGRQLRAAPLGLSLHPTDTLTDREWSETRVALCWLNGQCYGALPRGTGLTNSMRFPSGSAT